MEQRGFTLIELLVVIAIIAVLAVVVVLTLNPAQLLAQARDSTRISDMATLKSAISFFLADQVSPASTALGTANVCYASSVLAPSTSGCNSRMTAATVATTTAALATGVGGTGWIPINFSLISSGSPIGSEPVDPTNNATFFYSYATNASPNFQFEIDAHMESTKYQNGGPADVESKDGGNNSAVYEVGTLLTL